MKFFTFYTRTLSLKILFFLICCNLISLNHSLSLYKEGSYIKERKPNTHRKLRLFGISGAMAGSLCIFSLCMSGSSSASVSARRRFREANSERNEHRRLEKLKRIEEDFVRGLIKKKKRRLLRELEEIGYDFDSLKDGQRRR
mmetsp:Transcript_4615/g.4799  ORF Transcript_4615/g.4799 Transcript_4615/m.4799 type:complete len:142 (+) Transcript_4615:9-434(+)